MNFLLLTSAPQKCGRIPLRPSIYFQGLAFRRRLHAVDHFEVILQFQLRKILPDFVVVTELCNNHENSYDLVFCIL